MLSEVTARFAVERTAAGIARPPFAYSDRAAMLLAVLLCSPIAAFAVDFNIDIQSSVGASASNASGGGPSRRVDCGSGTCAITTADDGILEYGIAARADIVKTGTSFTITAQGESELLQGSPYVTGTGDFAATIRIYSQTATSEQFVVKTVGDLKVTWQGLIPTSAGKAKAWFGTPCPDWGLNVESDASTPSGELGPTSKTVRCVRTADPPPWFKIFEMTVEMKAAAGNKVVGENTSFNGTVTFEIKSKGKEMFKEGGDNQETLVGHALPNPLTVRVLQNDTDAPVGGVPIQFTVKDPDGNVVGNVLTAETQAPDGIASVSGVMLGNVAGIYAIEAYCAACVAGQRIAFSARAKPIETIIEKLPGEASGDGQRALVGTRLLIPLRARVKRTDGTLLKDVRVDFSQTAGPSLGTFSNSSPLTDERGIASTYFTLASAEGAYALEAFCDICATNPGNRVPYTDHGEGKKPSTDIHQEQDSGSGEACSIKIYRVDKSPNGSKPPDPYAAIPACVKKIVKLKCRSAQFPAARCESWTPVLPPQFPADTTLTLWPTSEEHATFFSETPWNFLVGAKLTPTSQCEGTRDISVWGLSPTAVVAQPKSYARKRVASGEARTLEVTLAKQRGSALELWEIRHLLNVTVEDSPKLWTPPFGYEVENVRGEHGSFAIVRQDDTAITVSIVVRFRENVTVLPEKVKVNIGVCDQGIPVEFAVAGDRDVLWVPSIPLFPKESP